MRFIYMISFVMFYIVMVVAKNEQCELDESGECLGSCVDKHEKCGEWSQLGECTKNPGFMLYSCALSCESCSFSQDEIIKPEESSPQNDSSQENDPAVEADEETPYGMSQIIQTEDDREALQDMIDYMEHVVFIDPTYQGAMKHCKNRHNSCVGWSIRGECAQNEKFMGETCAPSCRSCHLLRSRKV